VGVLFFLIPYLLLSITFPALSETSSPDQLLRQAYHSDSTNLNREYFVYLPEGYASDREKSWPVLFFLHGHE
jgi:poly(3-hydroxybutyrate) depolymerase